MNTANRSLGALGVIGGIGLLAAFVVDIPSDVNVVRLVLFNAAAIAIAIAVLRVHSPASRGPVLAGALPAIAANAWALAWVLLAIGRDRPFAGDFGLVGFYAGPGLAWILLGLELLVCLHVARVEERT